MTWKARTYFAVTGLVISAVIGACSSGSGSQQGAADAPQRTHGEVGSLSRDSALDKGERASSAPAASTPATQTPASGSTPRPGLPTVTPNVIKTARLQLEVKEGKLQESVQAGVAVAERYGGFVVSTALDEEKASYGTVVVRVPAERFGQALEELKELGDVEGQSVSGQDVTQEFVDLEARLRNFSAQEAVLLRLMDRSRTVADTIRVQRELQGVQLEIERIRGRLRYLRDQTSMATIELNVREVGAAPGPDTMLERAWKRALRLSLSVVSAVIVGAGFVVPVAALGALVLFLFARLRPRLSGS